MRLIATLKDQKSGHTLSNYLRKNGIENELEIISNTDWGSADYGIATCRIWSIDEDQFESALNIAHEFIANPLDPKFQTQEKSLTNIFEPVQETLKAAPKKIIMKGQRSPRKQEPIGILTLYLLVICCVLFLFTEIAAPVVQTPPPGIPYIPLYYSELKKELLFDYPQAFDIIDKLINTYGVDKLQNANDLPPSGKALLEKFYVTPYWTGFYGKLVQHLQNPHLPWSIDAPIFEKLQEGQWWRLFSPILLHSDIFHLLFNMIWLAVLGKQLENRMGKFRFLFFVLITAVITNTAQYMMSGSNFLGFSGVLCAMLSFIWVRQRKAPWEGYLLLPSTLGFIMFFLFTVLFIQLVSFYTEVSWGRTLSPYIANTAHMSGLLSGWILGRLNFFSWHNN